MTDLFPYKLDDFQIAAIAAIDDDKHVLVMAHTGSGKTTVAKYAILKHIALGHKVIYTSPIKALSNQIYKNISLEYPHINIGIKTGDIEINSDADLVIMTTEILRNELHNDTINNLYCVIPLFN